MTLQLRLRHLWLVPGLAIAVYASTQATNLGLGIVPLLVFTIVPDLPRLLAIGQPHKHGHMATRAVPAFSLLHLPLLPLAIVGLAVAGVLPPVWYVGGLAWLGHIVLGIGIGDRMRRGDGSLPPLWTHWPVESPVTTGEPAGSRAAESRA